MVSRHKHKITFSVSGCTYDTCIVRVFEEYASLSSAITKQKSLPLGYYHYSEKHDKNFVIKISDSFDGSDSNFVMINDSFDGFDSAYHVLFCVAREPKGRSGNEYIACAHTDAFPGENKTKHAAAPRSYHGTHA